MSAIFISDLGMCQLSNNEERSDKKGVYGLLKYVKDLDRKFLKIFQKFLVDLIMKCWDAEAKNRPNAKELYHILKKLEEKEHKDDEIRSQMEEYDKIRKRKLKNRSNGNKSEGIKTYTQAIYASRLLNFKNLPEPINSSDFSSFQFNSDLIEINQEGNDLNDES
ncbi:hypothetical protein RhiirA5_420265 [Rhizophagus irregularis]|uniref:Serine-threonine/tyrosine-protein kinase catalytic domain-containing protein n=2 Tax=Rhizophagus irregularis TaxID=588596 RepID=A0A2N0PGJ6_9GLOM|nr:hypothetical protein RhiirA5_420265 [Rhizophagus irregularis]PKC60865.1 hypothetical protein RhiirA1_467433 [Rhizophagus irregularis]